MAIAEGTFEILKPCQYICFTYPNPSNPAHILKFSVLDSPHFHTPHNLSVGAMLVPHGRQHDWIFSTLSGHHQLLTSTQASRLILISTTNQTDSIKYIKQIQSEQEEEDLKTSLGPLLLALSPRIAFQSGIPHIPFVSYSDNVVQSRVLEIFSSPETGKMLVENVEIEVEKRGEMVAEWRRRLRFERMPNLVQTEVALLKGILDKDRLVHPYLGPIVDGLVLVGNTIDCFKNPKFLCIGVGGGALPVFLNRHFGWISIVGVEKDEIVLKAANKYFGLVENERLRIKVGDGLQIVQQIAQKVAANDPKNPNPENPKPRNPNPRNPNYENLNPRNPNYKNPVPRNNNSKIPNPRNPNSENPYPRNPISKKPDLRNPNSENPYPRNPVSKKPDPRNPNSENPNPRNPNSTNHNPGDPDSKSPNPRDPNSKNANPRDPDSKNPNPRNPNPKNPNRETLNCSPKEKDYGGGGDDDDPRVHVIIVDVDAGDAKTGLNAPPMEFVEKGFLLSLRMALHPCGIMAMNVIPPANGECFYNDLISTFGEVFSQVYDIQVNDQNYVLFASPSSLDRDDGMFSDFAKRVKQVTGGEYMDRIRHHVLS